MTKSLNALVLIVALFAGATIALAESYLQQRVVVHLKRGGTIAGIVVAEREDGAIQLQLAGGKVWLRKDRIQKIEVKKKPEDEYAEREKKCKTPDDWVELARWCGLGDVRLPGKRLSCLRKALEIDPDHESANREIGNVRVQGKWYPEEEGNKLLGKVEIDGKWYPRHEAERIERRRELRSKNKYLRGLLKQEEERLGIPWATADLIKSQNYEVKCNSTKDVAQRYSRVMEALFVAHNSIFPVTDYPRYVEEPGRVYIFRNHNEFIDFTLMGPNIGGFFSFADRAVRAYHGSFGVTGSTDMVLAHEATHQFQYRIMKDMRTVPTWLIEGMAVYYGDGTEITPERVELHKIPRDRLHTLQLAIRTERHSPLKQLIRLPQARFTGQYYDHAWGIIYWCLQGQNYKAHNGEGKKLWDRYLKHVCENSPSATEVQDITKHLDAEASLFEKMIVEETKYDSVDAWETAYKKFVLDLPLEPLGTWKGLRWTGGENIGISVRFPRGLIPVDENELRQEAGEAAAAQSREGDLRMWLTVYSTPMTGMKLDKENFELFSRGMFRREDAYIEAPQEIVINNAIGLTRAVFRGRHQERTERSTFAVNEASSGEEKASKDENETKLAPAVDPEVKLQFEVVMLATSDKIFVVALAGLEAPHSKIAPDFRKSLESIRLSF